MIRVYRQWVQRFLMTGIFAASLSSLFIVATNSSADVVPELLDGADLAAQNVPLSVPDDLERYALAAADTAPMGAAVPGDDFDEDPWEGFNEKMFWFNREILDRFLLKPVATGWDFIFPNPVQRGFHNFFDNLAVVRRVVNNTLQLKLTGAGTELARFTINSTIGVVGFFDVAKDAFGINPRDEDTGQTFGVWGMGPGRCGNDSLYLFYPLVGQRRRHRDEYGKRAILEP